MYSSSVSRRISVARHSRLCVLKGKSSMQRSHLQGHSVIFFGLLAEVGRLGRSSSAAGVRQVGGGDVQRQSSLPAREALNQVNTRHAASSQPENCAAFIQETERDINIVLIITSPPVRDSGPGRSIYSGKMCPMSTIRFWPCSKEEAQ